MGKYSRRSTLSVAKNVAALWYDRWWCGSCVVRCTLRRCVPLGCPGSSSRMPLPSWQHENVEVIPTVEIKKAEG